jgi:2-oxoglutarate ferredoxin oxidoreductase subunit alpha
VHELLRHLVDKIENRAGRLAKYKAFFLRDAEDILISYGSSARSARHVAEERRMRGERIGLLELQTLWPFPAKLVREACKDARSVVVVEMNMGQVMTAVKQAVDHPERVFLANRIDGVFITPEDIMRILRIIQGRGV